MRLAGIRTQRNDEKREAEEPSFRRSRRPNENSRVLHRRDKVHRVITIALQLVTVFI